MSKKVNPAAVGIFVAGAVIIILTTLVLLGTGRYFEKRGRFVIYFESSANGLEEGSDVLLGGVKVGSVKKMFVQFDPETRAKVIPVVIELSGDRLAALSADSSYTREEILSEESLSRAIEDNGLRARLMTKSVLTGQLYVDLEFFVEKVESYRFPGETVDGLLQIPSTKNEIERVLESIAEGVHELGDIEFAKLIEHVDQLVTNLDDKLGELDLAGISDRTKGTLEKADAAFADFGDALQNENLKSAIANLDEAAEELKNLVVAPFRQRAGRFPRPGRGQHRGPDHPGLRDRGAPEPDPRQSRGGVPLDQEPRRLPEAQSQRHHRRQETPLTATPVPTTP